MSEHHRRPSDQIPDVPSSEPDSKEFDCPSAAFDALYAAHAGPLVRQVVLLTGRARLARRAVARAFRAAWQRWPEVAADPDPPGWVRAAAYDWALAPWRGPFARWRPAERPGPGTPAPPPAAPADRALLAAVLALPAPYRRALLLHDGVGLGLHATAVEVEASTAAATGRLTHARECLAEEVPELGLRGLPPDRQGAVLHARLAALAAARPVAPPAAREVRAGAERCARLTTRAGFGAAGLLAATALTVSLGAPDGHRPPRPAVAAPSAPSGHPAAPAAFPPTHERPPRQAHERTPKQHHKRARHRSRGTRLAPDLR
ncbi:hypothetical protein ACFC0M_38910 [Streptomyces sp. NPDC056149]|uniref:hypothetical protein n=1 Tax=Streptomyces sp. NPDC056149 TaxID=3345728 RepID=UPI0035D7F3D4